MPDTGAIAAFGTLLKRGDGATPEVFTAIAEVGDIAGPSLKLQLEEVTNHGSPGGFEERIPTTKSAGSIKFPISFLPTGSTHSYSTGLLKDWSNKTKRNFQMVFPDSTTWSFAAYVDQVDFKAPVKKALVADVTLTITGLVTLT